MINTYKRDVNSYKVSAIRNHERIARSLVKRTLGAIVHKAGWKPWMAEKMSINFICAAVSVSSVLVVGYITAGLLIFADFRTFYSTALDDVAEFNVGFCTHEMSSNEKNTKDYR